MLENQLKIKVEHMGFEFWKIIETLVIIKKLIGMGTSIIVFIEKLFYLNMLNICDYGKINLSSCNGYFQQELN